MRVAVSALLLAAAGIAAVPLLAQRAPMGGMPAMQGAGSPADVAAGTYAVEPEHTQVSFTVTHFGITPFTGMFSGASGSVTLDPANPGASPLSVSLPIASVQTTSAKLTDELGYRPAVRPLVDEAVCAAGGEPGGISARIEVDRVDSRVPASSRNAVAPG